MIIGKQRNLFYVLVRIKQHEGYFVALSQRQRAYFSIIVSWGGGRLSPLVIRPLTGLLFQPRMIYDDECGAVGGMRIGK
jgi:hypothetical protein